MKRTYLSIIFVLILMAILVGCTKHISENESKIGEEKNCNLKLSNDQSYQVIIGKFETPYSPKYIKSISEIDFSNMNQFIDAHFSASSYGWDNYLSMLDEGAKKEVIEVDTESNGTYSNSFNDNIGKPPLNDMPIIYTHWIEFSLNAKVYRLIVGGRFEKEEDQSITPFIVIVKKDGKWLKTSDLDFDPLITEITLKDYDSLLRNCS